METNYFRERPASVVSILEAAGKAKEGPPCPWSGRRSATVPFLQLEATGLVVHLIGGGCLSAAAAAEQATADDVDGSDDAASTTTAPRTNARKKRKAGKWRTNKEHREALPFSGPLPEPRSMLITIVATNLDVIDARRPLRATAIDSATEERPRSPPLRSVPKNMRPVGAFQHFLPTDLER